MGLDGPDHRRTGSRGRARLPPAALGALGTAALLLAGLGGCSSQREKLSDSNNVGDVLFYEILQRDRNPTYYYETVRGSHDAERFGYVRSDDPYLVDKNVNAIQKLGQATFARLEGEAQVVALLTEVLLEDPSALAQASAANSLTRLGLKIPQYRSRGLEERGDRFLALLQELDRIHAAGCTGAATLANSRARVVQILGEIGSFEMATLTLARDALKPFYTRSYLIDASDPAIRQAADAALTRRMGEVIRLALRSAVDAEVAYVREGAIRGLKTLGDRTGENAVLARLSVETNWRVRAEIAELLEDPDPSIAHKARQGLRRIAGRDYGIRRRAWKRWAHQLYPELARREQEAREEIDDAAAADLPVP
jgi:hypothetical protein